MSRIKEVSISVKLSHDYNTYECAEVIEIEATDNVEEVKAESFARCRKNCFNQCALGGYKKGLPKL